jgi:hypothetical protein
MYFTSSFIYGKKLCKTGVLRSSFSDSELLTSCRNESRNLSWDANNGLSVFSNLVIGLTIATQVNCMWNVPGLCLRAV